MSSYISRMKPNGAEGTEYKLKDEEARSAIQNTNNNVRGRQSASGSIVTITDAAPINAEEVIVDFEPQQDLHGYDHPWVGGAGKNKLNYDSWKNVGIARGTGVAENNGLTLTATADDCFTSYAVSQGGYPSDAKIYVSEGETITISWDIDSNDPLGDLYIFPNGSITGYVKTVNTAKELSYTVTSGITYITFRVGVDTSGNTVHYKNIMIRKSGDSSYEPYSNICPIQGYDIVNVEDCGKNLFDESIFLQANNWTLRADGYYQGSSYDLVQKFINGFDIVLKPNTQYAISFKAWTSNPGTYSAYNFKFIYTDGTEDTVYGKATTETEYTLVSNASKSVDKLLFTYGSNASICIKDFQLEESSSATTYEPYNGQIISVQVGNKNLLPMTVSGLKSANPSGTWSGNTYTYNGVTFTILEDNNGLVTGIKAKRVNTSDTYSVFTLDISHYENYAGKQLILNGGIDSNNYIQMYRSTGGNVVANGSDASFEASTTAPSSWNIAIIVGTNSTINDSVFYPMIRLASVLDSTFSPYNSMFSNLAYSGKLNLTTGELVVDRGYVDLGTLTWGVSSGSLFYTTIMSDILKTADGLGAMICSAYQNKGYTGTGSITNGCIGSNGFTYLYLNDNRATTGTEVKTLLNGVILVYPLATPQTYQLTPAELKLLKEQNTITTNGTTISLKYQPDNVIGEVKVEVDDVEDKIAEISFGNYSRNLFNAENMYGKYDSGFTSNYNESTHELTVSGKWFGYWIIPVERNTNYTIKRELVSYTQSTQVSVYPATSDGQYGSVIGPQMAIITGSETQIATFNSGDYDYISVLCYASSSNSNTGVSVYKNIQLVKGENEIAYESYIPTNAELYEMIKALQQNS